MKIETWPIDKLVPYARNPRQNASAVDAVAASIREFGWRVPLVVAPDGTIVCGHTRLLAARKLGMTEVPVHIASELTEAQLKAFRIFDNKSHELASWDDTLLPLELRDLEALGIDLSTLAFPEDELKRLLAPAANAGLCDPDEVPAPPSEPIMQRGDVWTLGEHRLICGDSTDVRDVQRLMANEQATMVFSDPPWNVAIGKDSNPRHRQRRGLVNDDLTGEQFEDFLSAFVLAMKPVVTGDIYIVLGAAEWPTLDRVLRGHGFHWSASIIWVKDVFVLGRSKYHRRYEPIWYGWSADGKSSYCGGRDQDDVWEIPRPRVSEEHPTMKPVALVAKAIGNSSKRGDLVYEPFCGSGSTLIACEQLGRRCRAIEIDPTYCDVVVKRWEQFSGQKATCEPESSPRERAPAAAEAEGNG
jgi:DNA modification methylase